MNDRARPECPAAPIRTRQRRPADPKPATLLQVAGAVFWSFFGVRKGRHMQQDTVTIKPLHVVIVGLLSRARVRPRADRAGELHHAQRRCLTARDVAISAQRARPPASSASVVSTSGHSRSHSPRASVTMPRSASAADHARASRGTDDDERATIRRPARAPRRPARRAARRAAAALRANTRATAPRRPPA